MNMSDLDGPVDNRPAESSLPLPPELEHADLWFDSVVAGAGIEVRQVPFVSVGGGIGSFVMADYLRVAGGLDVSEVRVLSRQTHPLQVYHHLARVSQIAEHGRIRSDASSRPDNLWGFPSYALQEALQENRLGPLLQVLVEPVLADFYTPRLSKIVESVAREAARIRYQEMLVQGNVQMVRKRVGGGYFTVITPQVEGPITASRPAPPPIAYLSRDVHLAVGYPGLRFLPDLQEFRERYDFHHVVNAYEEHEHVYQALRLRPGTVLVRGGGIAASQVLDRLIQDRMRGGAQTRILHLFRTYIEEAHGPHAWARRPGGDGFAYQGFNYPKSVWGGQLRARMGDLEGQDRIDVYDEIGGTTTPRREEWQQQLEEGRSAGWYRAHTGTIRDLRLEDEAVIARMSPPHDSVELRVDYVIDCTGLDGDIEEHPVLRDLLKHGGAQRNPLGRLDVDQSFQLRGAESGEGRIYASGAATYGGYFPGVDTFLGLQISAQEIVYDLANRGHCDFMGPVRSTVEWFKWATGRQI